METAKSGKRINSLQGLRFFFCSLIVINHIIRDSFNFDFGGESGVTFFFVLSGFILTLVYGGRVEEGRLSTRRLFMHQLSKFFPLHVTMLVLMSLAFLHAGSDVPLDKLVTNFFLVQSWIPSDYYFLSINNVSWFLCDILFFYLCFKGLYKVVMFSSRRRLTAIVVVVLCVYAVIMVITPSDHIDNFLYCNPALRLIDCFLGMVLCRFYKSESGHRLTERINGLSGGALDAVSFGLLAVLAIMFLGYETILPHRFTTASFFWLYMLIIVFWYVSIDGRSDSVFVRILKYPFTVRMGDLTMEVYLTQAFTILAVNTILAYFGLYFGHIFLVFLVEFPAVNFAGWLAHQVFRRVKIKVG